jgi:hypothetical protein
MIAQAEAATAHKVWKEGTSHTARLWVPVMCGPCATEAPAGGAEKGCTGCQLTEQHSQHPGYTYQLHHIPPQYREASLPTGGGRHPQHCTSCRTPWAFIMSFMLVMKFIPSEAQLHLVYSCAIPAQHGRGPIPSELHVNC